ncbi:MAG: hypothetical protein NCW75_03180 [Phycisphaera sp.]|nr:MAG: hypothetical protein NCW75_03180 [Phycisphaera sp.]
MQQTARPLIVLAAVALPTLAAISASAQTLNEDSKLTASDAEDGDQFGRSVAISGTTVIAGASLDEDGGPGAGSAYILDLTTGEELFKLTSSDAQAFDSFGNSVAISGTTAIVGAYESDDAGSRSGSAYLFDAATGQELFKLTASDAAALDQFGFSVDISGTLAIVGAAGVASSTGSAYIFDTTTGQQLFELTARDAAADDFFGASVAISGPVAIVGAYRNDDAGSQSGSAYLFNATTGQQFFKLTASDAAPFDSFGISVAISGTTAVIGAFRDGEGGSQSGSAYIFDTTTGQELFKLTASDADREDWFGSSVAISGTTAIVGSFQDDDSGLSSGSAYIFDTTTGEQLFKLTASDAEEFDFLGSSVAISDSSAIAGTWGDDDAGTESGSAYVFDLIACQADLDGDGELTIFDFLAFQNLFDTGDLAADFDSDGALTIFDFLAFQNAFDAGCP